ncbi:Fungal specific transcription factor [Ascosphaera acerosa]|nr:Fungal specific transcription factor [Ascosphaera acerosa]
MTPGPDEHIIHICRSAAKTRLISALDFVNRLRPHHLASPWPFYARFCLSLVGSFGVLLRITAKTKSEYAFYGRRLGEYIWTLGVSQSWGGSWVAWASERVREVVDAANQAAVPEKPDVVEPVAMAVWSGGSSRGGTSASGGGGGGETAQAGSTAQSLSRPWAGISTDPGDGPGLSDPENDSDDVESDGSAEDDITGPDTAERSATSVEDDRSDSSVSPGAPGVVEA